MLLRFVLVCVLMLLGVWPSFAQHIMPSQRQELLRSLLPRIEYKEDHDRLHNDPTTIFYTLKEMPAAHQRGSGQNTSFLIADKNESGDNAAPFFSSSKPNGRGGNANIDFPWRRGVPGGTHRTNNVGSFKAMWLPKKADGTPWPVVWFRDSLPNPISSRGAMNGYRWVFPRGTIFYEVLHMKDPVSKANYVFEIRKREREIGEWSVDVFRPFPTAEHLAERLRDSWGWWNSPLKVSLVKYMGDSSTLIRSTLEDRINRNRSTINVVQAVDKLPEISDRKLIHNLLRNTTFESCIGIPWKEGTLDCFAPTASTDQLNIVPHNYDGTFLGADSQSCMKCHESTLVHSRFFDRQRGWYGYVRGSDGILSWHPIALDSLSTTGFGIPVRFRPEFVRAGVIAKFNSQLHTSGRYKTIKGLK